MHIHFLNEHNELKFKSIFWKKYNVMKIIIVMIGIAIIIIHSFHFC